MRSAQKPNTSGAVEQNPSTQESTPVEEAYIPEELEEYLRELKRNGQPIKAIQKLRNVTGMSLSEAKQFVDDIYPFTKTECLSRRLTPSLGHSFFISDPLHYSGNIFGTFTSPGHPFFSPPPS